MTRRRMAVWAAALVLVVGALAQAWINGQTVQLIVVNASGRPVEVSWQSYPFGAAASATDGGCNARSMRLSRGTSWSVARDGDTVLDSSAAGLPLISPLAAVEVWFNPDGSVRVVAPHDVAQLVDLPYPDCVNAAS